MKFSWGTDGGLPPKLQDALKRLEEISKSDSRPSQFKNSIGQALRYDFSPTYLGALRSPVIFTPQNDNERTFFESDNKHSIQAVSGAYQGSIALTYSVKKKSTTERTVLVFGDVPGTFWNASTGTGFYVTIDASTMRVYKRIAGTNTLIGTLAVLTENATTDYVDLSCIVWTLSDPMQFMVSANGVYLTFSVAGMAMTGGGYLGLSEFGPSNEEVLYKPAGLAASQLNALSQDLLNVNLDGIQDGATYKKILSVVGGQVTAPSIADLAVISAKIADAAVITAKLADLSVVTAKLADLGVTGAKIDNVTITGGKLVAHTITANEIAALTITAAEIAGNTITAAKIAAGTITTTEIAASTITGGNIAALTITGGNIAASTITAGKLSVATLSSITADVGTLTAGLIQNSGATAGIRLSGSLPGTWTRYLDLAATGANPFLHHDLLDLNIDGTAIFKGPVNITVSYTDVGAWWLTERDTAHVAHGMTTIAPTDVFGILTRLNINDGGVQLIGLTETGEAIRLSAIATTPATGDTNASGAVCTLDVSKKSGTGNQAIGATDNALTVINILTTSLLILKGDGRLLLGLGAVGTPSYSFIGDANTGMYSPSADDLAFATGGVKGLEIDATQRVIRLKAGGAAVANHLGGVLSAVADSVVTITGATEGDMKSYTVLANTLDASYRAVRFEGWGTMTANTTSKTIRIYYGGTVVNSISSTNANIRSWHITGIIHYTGASAQEVWSEIEISDASGQTLPSVFASIERALPAKSNTVDQILKCTGQGGVSTSVSQYTFDVWYTP